MIFGWGQAVSLRSGEQYKRPDVAALREAIDARLRGRAAFSDTNYSDEPIIFSGKKLKSYVPEQLAQARALAHSPAMLHHSEAYIFWRQARLLADYEDDFEYHGHFSRYFPTYQLMSSEQLRGYFSWRTQWRQGKVQATETSFVYLCAYELLHCVGVDDALQAHKQLSRLRKDYGKNLLDHRLFKNLTEWMDEFVIYWDLPQELLEELPHRDEDSVLQVLSAISDASDEQLFSALTGLSSYHIESSALYKARPAAVRHVVCGVVRKVSAHHDRSLKRSMLESYCGVCTERDFPMLRNAVFADPRAGADRSYELSPFDQLYCRHGFWSRKRYWGMAKSRKKFGELLKTIDAAMREQLNFELAIESPLKTRYIVKAARELTQQIVDEQKAAERRAVHIDFSKLGGIRAAADTTRDRLIVEEEPEFVSDFAAVTTEVSEPDATDKGRSEHAGKDCRVTTEVSKPDTTVKLSDEEQALLSCLLEQNSVHAFEREHQLMASLLIESINGKLMDVIGDVVIDAGSDEPQIYEDYFDDIRELHHA